MSKYINALREKGRELFNSYLALKKHLEELKFTIEKLERENDQKKEVIAKLKGMEIRVVEFSSRKYFYIRINIPKGNYRSLSLGLMSSCRGHHFSNKK